MADLFGVGEGGAGAYVGGGGSDVNGEFAWLYCPFRGGGAVEFEVIGGDSEGHRGGLAGSEVDFLEAFEFFEWAEH